jgi:nitrogen regulatory protein PII-like uncharacterized protein
METLSTENIVHHWAVKSINIIPAYHSNPVAKELLIATYPPEAFDTYSDIVKRALAVAFVVSKEKRLEILSAEEDSELSLQYHIIMTEIRKEKITRVIAWIYNNSETSSVGKTLVHACLSLFDRYTVGIDITREDFPLSPETVFNVTFFDTLGI